MALATLLVGWVAVRLTVMADGPARQPVDVSLPVAASVASVPPVAPSWSPPAEQPAALDGRTDIAAAPGGGAGGGDATSAQPGSPAAIAPRLAEPVPTPAPLPVPVATGHLIIWLDAVAGGSADAGAPAPDLPLDASGQSGATHQGTSSTQPRP